MYSRHLWMLVGLFALALLCLTNASAETTLSGTVTDDGTGLPMENVMVVSINAQTSEMNLTNTDALGHYLLNVTAGNYYLMAFYQLSDYYNFFRVNIEIDEDEQEVQDFTMLAHGGEDSSVAGMVTDNATGDPLNETQIGMWNTPAERWYERDNEADGSYNFTLFPGDWRLSAKHDDYYEEERMIQLANDKHLYEDFALDPKLPEDTRFYGVVTDNLTGDPMANITVAVEDSHGEHNETTTDANGNFSMNVHAGEYLVTVMGPRGYGNAMLEIEFPADDEVEQDFALDPSNVRGFVLDENGDPIPGTIVASFALDNFGEDMDPPMVMAEADGYYEFTVAPNYYWFLAMIQGGNYAANVSRVTVIDLETVIWANMTIWENDATISGVVTDPDGQPLEGARVSVVGKYMPIMFAPSNSTDAAGHYELELPRGDYIVQATYTGEEDEGEGPDPFSSGIYDANFTFLSVLDDGHEVVNAQLFEPQPATMYATATIAANWSYADIEMVMTTSPAGTTMLRLFLDSIVGDGDFALSAEEQTLGEAFMNKMGDDNESDDDGEDDPLYVDDIPFTDNKDDDPSFSFTGLVGAWDDGGSASIQMSFATVAEEPVPVRDNHTVRFNQSYDKPGEDSRTTLILPTSWLLVSYEATANVTVNGTTTIIVDPQQDLDLEDDIDSEWVVLEVERENEPPTANISSIVPDPTYRGESVNFTGLGTDTDGTIATYQWTIDGWSAANTATFGLANLSLGDHRAELRVQDDDGAWSAWVWQNFTILNRAPVAAMNVTPDPGEIEVVVNFTSLGTDADGSIASHQWDFDDDGTFDASGVTATHTFTTEGFYTITLRVTDDDGASDEATHLLEITGPNAIPTAIIDTPGPVTVPNGPTGGAVMLTGHGSDTDGTIVTCKWELDSVPVDSSNSTTLNLTGLTGGAHTITFHVMDNEGAWSAPASIAVTVQSPPVARLTFTVGEAGKLTTFDASTSEGVGLTYTIDFGDGATYGPTTEPTSSHVYNNAGSFSVTLTVTDDLGQSDTHTVSVEVPEAEEDDEVPALPLVGALGVLLLVALRRRR